MSWLIDTNELMEWVKNWLKMDHYYHPVEKQNDIPISELEDIIKRMPTVDAIPVEWIKKYMSRCLAIEQDAIGEMVKEWAERREEC